MGIHGRRAATLRDGNIKLVVNPEAHLVFRRFNGDDESVRKYLKVTGDQLTILRQWEDQARTIGAVLPCASPEDLSIVDRLLERCLLITDEMPCLITGCARSGTRYIATALTASDLEIGHETMGRDGIASWLLAVQSEWVPWGPLPGVFKFKNILHQVRAPLHTISSLQTLLPISWHYACAYIMCTMNAPLIVRCMKYYVEWNRLAKAKATFTYRVEHIGDVLADLSALLGVTIDRSVVFGIPADVNSRRGLFRSVGWDDLRRADEKLACEVASVAEEFGYDRSSSRMR